MRSFSDKELDDLVRCPKKVVDPPKRAMRQDGQMQRNDFTLASLDERHSFRAFLRQNSMFQENFSLGMIYLPGEDPGSFQLIRMNGKHGGERAHPHHALFHIHRMKADDINAGVLEPRFIEKTTSYASFREALAFFCKSLDIQEADTHFPGIYQGRLFTGEEIEL